MRKAIAFDFTREAGGTTNLYKTSYAYSYFSYGRQLIRTEQTYSGGWNDDNHAFGVVTYRWDPAQAGLHCNTVGGYTTDYGNNEDLSYTFNEVNQMSAIADADDNGFSCTVTCDANNNITQIEEVQTVGMDTATLTTDFTYDWGNRLTQHKTLQYNNGQGDIWVTERGHTIDAIGRTVKSSFLDYWATDLPPSPDTLEHVYDRSRHIQNYDGSTYGEVWHWAGMGNIYGAPVRSPNPDTASQVGYNIANEKTPQRRTFLNPTSEGDQRHLYGQGKPQAKNSSGSGANWYLGTKSESISAVSVYSRAMFEGTMTATDMDRATDAREKGRIGIFGTGNAYAGSSGRVTSERIGRDLNPLGRGDGYAYVGGEMRYGRFAPSLPMSNARPGNGNSVNNPVGGGGEGGRQCSSGMPCCCYDVICRNSVWTWELDYPCYHICDYTEWASNYEDCKCRECKCIASGCRDDFCKIENNCQAFLDCGCENYGQCNTDSYWYETPGNICIPGSYSMTCGDSGLDSDGGPNSSSCPSCGGGGLTKPPNGDKDWENKDCMQAFMDARDILQEVACMGCEDPNCCCQKSSKCDICKHAGPFISGMEVPNEVKKSDKGHSEDCAGYPPIPPNPLLVCCYVWGEDVEGGEGSPTPRVMHTFCGNKSMKNNICCQNFNPPYTACGGNQLGTSNSTCAALIYLLIEAYTCSLKKGEKISENCCKEAIEVGKCICDNNDSTK